jgi:methionyl-tRNA synthetase
MFGRYWPGTHLIGKDILRQHAIYWPAMLMAGGVEPPRQVWAHGFLTVGGQKMSKTNATGVHPFQLIDEFGVDAYRYYFMREIQFGQDGNFSWESMTERHTADLANGLGNLASRVLAMLESSFDGVVPPPSVDGAAADLPEVVAESVCRTDELMLQLALSQAIGAVWEIVGRANRYLVEKQPWRMAKDEARREELGSVLYAAAEALRVLAVLLSPIMPGAAERLWQQLGIQEPLSSMRLPEAGSWGGLQPGTLTKRGGSLFPRLEA